MLSSARSAVQCPISMSTIIPLFNFQMIEMGVMSWSNSVQTTDCPVRHVMVMLPVFHNSRDRLQVVQNCSNTNVGLCVPTPKSHSPPSIDTFRSVSCLT